MHKHNLPDRVLVLCHISFDIYNSLCQKEVGKCVIRDFIDVSRFTICSYSKRGYQYLPDAVLVRHSQAGRDSEIAPTVCFM